MKKISKSFHKKLKSGAGFTLIELLVVVAIIGLLASIALIALVQARAKSRDAKRLGDMTQMNTGLELYFATNKGYPSGTAGVPQGMKPQFLATIPTAPTPPDGLCIGQGHSAACTAADASCSGAQMNTYFYAPSGTPYTYNGTTVYPDYVYFFCLGAKTGNFDPGEKILTPTGMR